MNLQLLLEKHFLDGYHAYPKPYLLLLTALDLGLVQRETNYLNLESSFLISIFSLLKER